MNHRKYQVFISASGLGLEAERKAAIEAVVKLGHLPIALERFSAAEPGDLEVIRRVIRESHVFLLIVGNRYGQAARGQGISYTELEYRLAQESGLATLVFLLDETSFREGREESGQNYDSSELENLVHWREMLRNSRWCHYFTPGPEFKYVVAEALANVVSNSETPGFVREDRDDTALLAISARQAEAMSLLVRDTKAWNEWRDSQPTLLPNLRKADLREVNLSRANLRGVDLRGADLTAADLEATDLTLADLSNAVLSHADLTSANLRGAVANGAQFLKARMSGASFRGAMLLGANFCGGDLTKADFRQATIGSTVFANIDLSTALGLDSIVHAEPSSITIDTLARCAGRVPEQFLRGVGLTEEFIAYARSISLKPLEYYSCFISYSSGDQDFAERIYSDLQEAGIRCWFAPQSLQIGDRFRERIDDSIRLHDKVLLILSEASVNSRWVETEITKALQEEERRLAPVLIPIRVDNAVLETDRPWAADLRRTRQIGDFREWRDQAMYQKAVSRLIRDLAVGRAVEVARRQA